MPRKPRTNYAGAWHHVGNRGVNKQIIYQDDNDRRAFLAILRDCLVETGSELHAYCLMTNHYHLLIHTPDASLSKLMQLASSRYTRSHNDRLGRSGPLFTSRFWSSLIPDDTALLEVSRYIHRNPIDISRTLPLSDYQWSSYGAFTGQRRTPRWLQTQMILQMMPGGHQGYRSYVEQLRPAENDHDAKDIALLIAYEQEGVSGADLARQLDVTPSSIRGRVRRIRAKAAADPAFYALLNATRAGAAAR